MSERIVIVGAGHGGAQCAMALRQRGHDGEILLVGEEPELPYERPPLSKELLKGEKDADQIRLRPEAFWDEKRIERRPGTRIVAVDPEARQLSSESGEAIAYDKLVWAAGGRARRLACKGADLDGIHTVRNLADVAALKADLEGRQNVLIVGGGYIGLEAAAALRHLDKSVTVIEAMPRLLARVAGQPVADFYAAAHRGAGVDLRLGTGLVEFRGDGRVEAAVLSDGKEITCELVICGIGIVPSVGPLTDAGAAGRDGVRVDAQCRTSLSDVFAIGDCALHRNRYGPEEAIRIESVQNANDMANAVARTLSGTPSDYDALPWFWSNQYDLKLQTVGLNHGYDRCLVRGSVEARSFSALYLREGRVIALDCINAVKDYVQGRKLIASGIKLPPERLADADTPIKQLLKESV